MGPDLMLQMRAQAERFGAELVADDVVALDLSGPVKTVTLGEGQVVSARSVILAMGSAYRELGLPDEKRLSGRGLVVRDLRRLLLATRTSRSSVVGTRPWRPPSSPSSPAR